jgi:apolipoprotein N-acyltransferase
MANKRVSHPPVSDRWSFLWLAIGTVLVIFSVGLMRITLAAWLAPVFLIRFMRTQKTGRGYLWILLALIVSNSIAWRFLVDISSLPPLLTMIIFIPIFALLYSIPYLIDRVLSHRLPGFAATLVFPLALTAFDYLSTMVDPMGSFGLWANALYSSPVFMQMVSVTGMYGLIFLMAWFASTAAWVWEQGLAWPKVWRGLVIFGACLALVIVYGNVRLSFFHPQPGTVRVHQIMDSDEELVTMHDAELASLLATETATFESKTIAVHQKYIEDTIHEARAGAQIVAWPEVAGIGDEEATAALLARGKEVAAQEGIYLVLPIYTVYPDPAVPVDNRLYIIDPTGEIVLEHEKYGCTAFNVSQLKLTVFDTPYGKMSAVMCCDLDFPTVIRQAGRQGVDIFFAPSNEPIASIVETHVQQAPFRAIENGFSLIRPTNLGISLYTDPYGRALAMADERLSSSNVMVVQVPTHGIKTIYTVIGDLFSWLAVVGSAAIVIWAILRGRKTHTEAATSPESQTPSV